MTSEGYEMAIRAMAEEWLLERANKEVLVRNPLRYAERVIEALRDKSERKETLP